MNRLFHIRPRTRRRLVWLVTLLLLWQQVAVAAYACAVVPSTDGAVAALTSSPAMAAMGDDCADMQQVPVDPLCRQHCQPDQMTQVDVHSASVPFNTLAAVPPMLLSMAVVALPAERAFAQLDQRRTRPPIPRLLFCSLLI